MSAIFAVATQSDTVISDAAFGGLFAAWMAFIVVISLLGLVALGLCIWNIVDVARRPDYQFEQSGQSKVLWILLPVLGIAVCQLIGVVAPIIYFTSVRKKLDAVPPPPWGANPAGGWAPYPPGYPGGAPWPGAYPYPTAPGGNGPQDMAPQPGQPPQPFPSPGFPPQGPADGPGAPDGRQA